MFDFDKVQGFVKKWQDILRLRDWDIKLEFVTTQDLTKAYRDLGAEDKSVCFGCIQPQADEEWGRA